MSALWWLVVMVFVSCLSSIFGQGPPSDGGGGGGGGADDNCVCILENKFDCESPNCDEFLDMSELSVVTLDESTSAVEGNVHFITGLQDPTKVAVVIEKCDGHGCQVVLNHIIDNMCNEIDNEKSQYRPQMINILFPPCPVPPGKVVFNGVELDMKTFPVNKNNQGRYKANMEMKGTNENGQDVTLAKIKFGFEIDCD